jgi:PAS domain S-box-containing protein
MKKINKEKPPLNQANRDYIKTQKRLEQSEAQLKERVKELRCLYEISKIDEYPNISLDEILKMVLELIPPAMQYPELTCVFINYLDIKIQTSNFQESEWTLCIQQEINNKNLILKVNYLEEKEFLKEEETLLKEIGHRLKSTIERKEAQKDLKRIEWLFDKLTIDKELFLPDYGDLTKINSERTILDAVGSELLQEIASEFLDLLETSSAVYERNGDYALGIFSSKWCRFLDGASRRLCNTESNQEALNSGKWYCHESCWNRASRVSIIKDKEIDMKCHGGLYIVAIPIKAGNQIIGSINFGYGDPPKDHKSLQKIAERYQVNIEHLKKLANNYESRPPYIIEIAKKRLKSAAQTIGYIVEGKQVEEALKLEKEFTDSILNASTDTIFVFDPNRNKAIRWNDAFRNVSGYSDKEIRSLKVPDAYYSTKDLERAKKATKKVLKHGEATIEMEFLTKKGESIPFEYKARAFKAENGNTLLVSIGRNIYKKKEAQRKLKKSEEKYRELVDLANSIVIRLDKDARISFINKFGESFFKYSKDDLMGKNVIGSIVPKTESSGRNLEELVESIFQNPEKNIQIENENITKSGKRVWVSWRNKALFDHKGDINGLLSTGIDITKRKKAEELVKKSEEKYREAFNRVTFYKDLIAHDMNNVLQTIQSSVELYNLIQKDPDTSQSQEEVFNIIKNQVSKGADIVSNIIKLSTIEDHEIVTKTMDVIYNLNKAIEHLHNTFNGKKIDITIHSEDDYYYIKANELLLDLFDNLLINAVKHNEQDLKVINIKISEDRLEETDYIKMEFIDNGIGISDDKKQGLFKKHFIKRERFGGLGIGLSLVNQIVESYKGKIWVENRIKEDYTKGSNFIILLPK